MADIINDTNGEVGTRLVSVEVIIYRLDHRRGELFRGQPVTATEDCRTLVEVNQTIAVTGINRLNDVHVERLATGARLFGAVEDADCLDRLRQCGEECFQRERAIEADVQHADLLTLLHHIFNSFQRSFNGGTHQHDDILSVFRAVILDEVILTSGQLGKLVHCFLNVSRDRIVILVARFASLEENIRVL
ncbi:hypothetical protein BMS3Bbin04_00128 [bacterium BMS3Bbin04]|nr:hypothetical protein BMS3Bbin04_00128 [bacterium BMS3Bbin04]